MNALDRFLAGVLFVLATACVAGIVHIVSIFGLPRLAAADPFARLSGLAASARLQLLPRPSPGPPLLPFEDPAIARGVCLFDLTAAPLRVVGTTDADRMLALSFRSRDGHVFFSMTDRAAVRGVLNILLLSPAQLEEIESSPSEDDETSQELRLVAPTLQGIVVVDALAARPGEWPAAEDRVRQIKCDSEPISEE